MRLLAGPFADQLGILERLDGTGSVRVLLAPYAAHAPHDTHPGGFQAAIKLPFPPRLRLTVLALAGSKGQRAYRRVLTMSISIAMATYNGARFLRQQLESLAAQTVLPCELVVCDDGSTDATLKILEDFGRTAPFPIHAHRNDLRLGYADNFLKAACLCTGDYIAFCDQDDVWLARKLELVANSLQQTSAVMAVHSWEATDSDLRRLHVRRYRSRTVRFPHPFRFGMGFSMTFKRSSFAPLLQAPRPPSGYGELHMPHDEWVPFLATGLGCQCFLPDILVKYRQHTTNTFGAPIHDASLSARLNAASEAVHDRYWSLASLAEQYAAFWLKYGNFAAPEYHSTGRVHDPGRTAEIFWKGVSEQYKRRAELYVASAFSRRARALTDLVIAGDYSLFSRESGLSGRSLAKDLSVTLMGAHRLQELIRRTLGSG